MSKLRTPMWWKVTAAILALGYGMAVPAVVSKATAQSSDLKVLYSRNSADSTTTIDHSAWTALLAKYVRAGNDGVNRVAYGAFKAEGHQALKGYIGQLEKVDLSKLSKQEQFAFWANLYNAKTIDVVLDHYPVESIKNITIGGGLFEALKSTVGAGGPWKAKIMTVSGKRLSLDDIEHGILRPIFNDPRVHYAVNCASIGCPNLRTEAFAGATLNVALDAAARDYVNHPRGITVSGGTVKASSIYSWFAGDFGGDAKGVLAHVRKYSSPALKSKLEGVKSISEYGYDWSLNDTK